MNRGVLSAIVLTSAVATVHGDGWFPLHLYSELEVSHLSGQARELVYTEGGSDELLSEIAWNIDNLFMWGAEVGVEPKAGRMGLHAAVRLRSGIAGLAGRVTDTDWANGDGVMTHYSEHDNVSEQAYTMDASAGWVIPIGRLSVEPFGYFEYRNFAYTARDGFLQYGENANRTDSFIEWNETFDKQNTYGTLMSYSQQWGSLGFGAAVVYRFTDWLLCEGSVRYAPFVYSEARDCHYITGTLYTDEMIGASAVDGELRLSYVLPRGVVCSLYGAYGTTGTVRGSSSYESIGTADVYERVHNRAGAEMWMMRFGVSVKKTY